MFPCQDHIYSVSNGNMLPVVLVKSADRFNFTQPGTHEGHDVKQDALDLVTSEPIAMLHFPWVVATGPLGD